MPPISFALPLRHMMLATPLFAIIFMLPYADAHKAFSPFRCHMAR